MERDLFSHLFPLGKGARVKGDRPFDFQYKDHTACPPFPAIFQLVHISHTNPSEREYIRPTNSIMSNKSCHHIHDIHKMKGFFLFPFY